MAKKSAADKLVARIDADIERIAGHANYIGGDGTDTLKARIDADLARLEGMRNYVTAAIPTAATDSAKPKRTRGKGKKAAAGTASTDRPEIGDVL